MSSVPTLALSAVGDKIAHLTVTPNLGGKTLLKAMIVLADEKNKPNVLEIKDIPAYMENGITIAAKDYLTNLKAGTAITIPFTGLTNGVRHNAKVQLLLKDSAGTTNVTEGALTGGFTPSGPASAPSILSTIADPNDDSTFTVRIARHTSDGGSPIAKVIYYLSKPDDGKGNVTNSIITKVADYSSMYTKNGNGEYPQWFETTFDNATDGIEADSNYEVTACFQNATSFGPMSEPVMSKSRNTPNAASNLVGSGSDGQVTVTGTSPNNNFVALIRGIIIYDQNPNTDDQMPPTYYSFDGANFTKVVDLDAMSAGFPMKDSAPFSFVISNLLNNVKYTFKLNFVSTNGKGDDSANFDVKAKKAPSAPSKPKVARYTPDKNSADATEAAYGAQIDLYQNGRQAVAEVKDPVSGNIITPAVAAVAPVVDSRYARIMALKYTWEDPLEDWATSSTKYTSSVVSGDVKTAAIEAALIRFVLAASADDNRTPAEKLLANDTVLANITNLANSVSLSQWTGYTDSQKLSVCSGSIQMRAAMTLYFAMVKFVKDQSDLSPVNINDNASSSQEWSRVVYTIAGATVKHSVTASIVDGSALITSPAAVIETATTDTVTDAKPNVATPTAKNGDIEVVIDRMLKPLGWTGVVYTILVSSTAGQQLVSYTPAYDTYGYAKKSTIMLARDLAIGLTNGVPVSISVGTQALIEPITGNLVNLSTYSTSSDITPVGKAEAPTFSFVVDQLNLNMQIKKPVLNGATQDKMQFALVREQDLPQAQAMTMSTAQLETYYRDSISSSLKLELDANAVTAGLLASGAYRAGYDYLISSTTFTTNATALPGAKVNYGHQLSLSFADGKTYYVLSRVTTSVSSSSSDFAFSTPFSFYSKPDAITGLTVKNSNGTLAANWTAPANDGFGSSTGGKIKDYIVELYNGGVKLKTYISLTNSFNISANDTVIGQTYNVNVIAENIFTDADGNNLKSTGFDLGSNLITSAASVDIQPPVIAADGKSISIAFAPNGSKIENLVVFGALDDGSDKVVPVTGTALQSSPITISATNLGINANALKVVSGLVVLTDTTSNGIKYSMF